MLPQDYKFHFQNNIGVDLDVATNSPNEKIDLDLRTYEFDSNGALVYNSETNLAYSAADVADGNAAEFTGQDNSATLALGLHGIVRIETDDAAASGTVDIYVESTTDGGTTFPSDAADFKVAEDATLVCSVPIAGDGAGYVRSRSFEWTGDG